MSFPEIRVSHIVRGRIPSALGKKAKPRRASMYVDQYTGEIKGKYERPAFFVTMFRLDVYKRQH